MPDDRDAFYRDVVDGLSAEQKTLPCKYLYDQTGSKLFDRITKLDAYYPTRTERSILQEYADQIAEAIGNNAALIELGSGSSDKTRIVLDQFTHERRLAAYVPIDISKYHLESAAERLQERYPDLTILPLAADYTLPLEFPALPGETHRKVIFFPGSTIGNFEPEEAHRFLERIARAVQPDGGLIIGIDLAKDRAVLERAYDDEEGVTAAFNKNLVARMSRELDLDVDETDFEHQARYNPEKSRVEMHLVSRRDLAFALNGSEVRLKQGETIHTENSYKYAEDDFRSLARQAGLDFEKSWTDERNWFAVHYYSSVVEAGAS